MSGLDRIAECKRARTPGAPVPCGRGRLTGATLIVRRHTIPRVTAEDCDIRPATPADSSAIRRIRNAAIRDSLAIWTEREQGPDEAVAWLEPQIARGTALVAVERNEGGERDDGDDGGERVVGFAVASPWHPYEGYARTVEDSVYLSPAARGRSSGPAGRRATAPWSPRSNPATPRPGACTRRRDSPSWAPSRPPGRSTAGSSTSPS